MLVADANPLHLKAAPDEVCIIVKYNKFCYVNIETTLGPEYQKEIDVKSYFI
jgi:hypothetical protein